MADIFTLSATDLAALLCSRVCHDIISPVGAINNGLELLDEGRLRRGRHEPHPHQRPQRLGAAAVRPHRFGAAGSAGMVIDTGDAEAVATAFLKNEKPEFTWSGQRALLPKNYVKLLLNMILVANAAIPRGGKIAVSLHDVDTRPRFVITSRGPMLAFRPLPRTPLRPRPEEAIDAHGVQPYYTLLLARDFRHGRFHHATPRRSPSTSSPKPSRPRRQPTDAGLGKLYPTDFPVLYPNPLG